MKGLHKLEWFIMPIDWQTVKIVECDIKTLTVTLKTAEGFCVASSTYNTKDSMMYNASKCWEQINKAKKGE